MERKRQYMGMCLAVLLCLVTALWGCQRSTTVILPPETYPTTVFTGEGSPTELPDAPTTQPTTLPTSAPTTAATTEPTSAPTTDPTTTPTTAPTSAPITEPATVPSTEPEPAKHPVYDISLHTVGSMEYSILDAINQQRTAAEDPLPPLTIDHTLCALAAIRAYECAESFSHTRPDGRSAYTVLSDYNYYIWSDLAERIHHGSPCLSAETIVTGWMFTPDFSANIMSDEFTHIGIGVFENGGITYITCFFAG